MSELNQSPLKPSKAVTGALRVALLYAGFSALWILLSDKAVGILIRDRAVMTQVSIAKGWVFVAVTAILLFVIVKRLVAHVVSREAKLQTLIRTIPDLVWLKNAEGVYIHCNRAFERLYGAKEAEIIGRTDYEFVPKDQADSFRQKDREAIEAKATRENEEWATLAETGKLVRLQTLKTPMYDAKGALIGVLGIGRDITEHHQLVTEQQQLQAKLHHSQKMESLGNLAGGVAHDMNNVLGAILGLASLQEAQAADGSALKRSMQTITKACLRGATLVKGLLTFARQSLAEEKILDLNTLVLEEMALLERTTLQRVRLEVDLAKDLLPIKGDSGALSNTLLNLCINAVDAMPEGGVLALSTRNEADGIVVLEVADSGSGMSRDVLDKATEPFFTTKPLGKGTGLGLSIVYGTMKAHDGTVEIQSEPGMGTRVTLRFPSCKPFPQDRESDPRSLEVPNQSALHVLLVDDDELIQGSVPELLKSMGHITTSANSGEEALAKLRGGLSPDVVLLDMNMPGLGGAGTLPQLRALLPAVPVILATGRVDQIVLALTASYKHVTLLAKPFGLKELQKQLGSLPSTAQRG